MAFYGGTHACNNHEDREIESHWYPRNLFYTSTLAISPENQNTIPIHCACFNTLFRQNCKLYAFLPFFTQCQCFRALPIFVAHGDFFGFTVV